MKPPLPPGGKPSNLCSNIYAAPSQISNKFHNQGNNITLFIYIYLSFSLFFFLAHNHAHISDPKTTANNPGSVRISSTDNLEDRRGQEDRSLAASVDSGLSSMASGASTASDLIDCVEELIALLEVTNTTKEATKCASDKVQSTFITSGASLLSLSLSLRHTTFLDHIKTQDRLFKLGTFDQHIVEVIFAN